jgi:hypothetical protein
MSEFDEILSAYKTKSIEDFYNKKMNRENIIKKY